MIIRLLAAALDEPLGSPSVVSITDGVSNGRNGNTAGIYFSSTGGYYRYRFGVPIFDSYWITPQVNMGDYEIRATLTSGDTPDTGTLDTWQALSGTREWTLTEETLDATETSTILIEIRWTGNNEVQDSATYVLTANNPTGGGGGGIPP